MFRRLAPLALVVAVAAALAPAPASAAPSSRLTLTVTSEDGFRTAATLRCQPAGGTHPAPARACATLARVNGDPGRLKPAEGFCTMHYAPVTATATGRWKGERVRYRQTFSNACVLRLATHGVFSF